MNPFEFIGWFFFILGMCCFGVAFGIAIKDLLEDDT